MAQEWRIIDQDRSHCHRRLYIDGRPTNRFMWDGQVGPSYRGLGPGTFGDWTVGASGDDGYRKFTPDGFSSTSTVCVAGELVGDVWHSFFRWTGVTIEGTIDVSYISVYPYLPGVEGQLLQIYGVDEDSPDAPTTYQEFDADTLTSETVAWDGPWSAGDWNDSPSLNVIFQELVDTYTISNAAVMLQVKDDGGSGYNRCYSWDYDIHQYAPKLHIEYTVGGITVTPDPATAIGAVVAPTVILGSITLSPTAVSAVGTVVAPTVILGSLTLSPGVASAVAGIANPTVILGSVSITPAAAQAIGAILGPDVILGSLVLSPTPAAAVSDVVNPTVVLGSLTLSPEAAAAIGDAQIGAIIMSSITITPEAAAAIAAIFGPTVVISGVPEGGEAGGWNWIWRA